MTIPTIAATLAVVARPWTCETTDLRKLFTPLGAISWRLSRKPCVVECPKSPKIETSTSMPGKIASTPKYVSAAARSPRSCRLNCFPERRRTWGQRLTDTLCWRMPDRATRWSAAVVMKSPLLRTTRLDTSVIPAFFEAVTASRATLPGAVQAVGIARTSSAYGPGPGMIIHVESCIGFSG
jgi:hypothetical protein